MRERHRSAIDSYPFNCNVFHFSSSLDTLISNVYIPFSNLLLLSFNFFLIFFLFFVQLSFIIIFPLDLLQLYYCFRISNRLIKLVHSSVSLFTDVLFFRFWHFPFSLPRCRDFFSNSPFLLRSQIFCFLASVQNLRSSNFLIV